MAVAAAGGAVPCPLMGAVVVYRDLRIAVVKGLADGQASQKENL